MKNKTQNRLIILCMLFVLLAAAYIFKDNYSKWFPAKPSLVFKSVHPQDISQLTIVKGEEKITVYKKNKQWFTKKGTDEFKADGDRIESLITVLIFLNKEEIVSTNRNKWSAFGIGSQKIIIKTETASNTLYVGKPYRSKNYVTADNTNEIFTAEGLAGIYEPWDYRDLRVPIVQDESKVSQVTVSNNGIEFSLTKKKNEWYMNDKKIKKDRVDFYISDLKTLKATDIVKQDTTQLFSSLNITVQESGKENDVQFFQQNENNYLLKTTGSPYTYIVPASAMTSLKKKPEDFMQ